MRAHQEINTSNTLLNYKIFNDGRFIISGFTEFRHTAGTIKFRSNKLPFNISSVISLNCSRYDGESIYPFDFSINYDSAENKIEIPIIFHDADEWNSLVWNIEGFI